MKMSEFAAEKSIVVNWRNKTLSFCVVFRLTWSIFDRSFGFCLSLDWEAANIAVVAGISLAVRN